MFVTKIDNRTVSHCFKGALLGQTILATESTLKIMKNDFYFTRKALFLLKILQFFSGLFRHVSKRLVRLISNFMTSQPC